MDAKVEESLAWEDQALAPEVDQALAQVLDYQIQIKAPPPLVAIAVFL